jgi:hypothetical protein
MKILTKREYAEHKLNKALLCFSYDFILTANISNNTSSEIGKLIERIYFENLEYEISKA